MQAVDDFLHQLSGVSILFLSAFWIGAMAALFSTADAQIYSFLVVREFNSKTGAVDNPQMAAIRPLKFALATTAVFAICFAIVDYTKIDFDQLVFLIFPVALNILPAFVRVVSNKMQSANYIWISVGLYAIFALLSAIRPSSEFFWRLLPPLMPMVVSVVAYFRK
jgi:hypothetical protein